MVIDTLSNCGRYAALHPKLERAFAFLREALGKQLSPGRYDVDGDDVYAMVQSYTTQPEGDRKWESHRRYLDVQFMLAGREAMLYAPVEALAPTGDFDAERDFQGYAEASGTALRCEEGTFALFWPQDAHKPCCQLDGPSDVKKIVVKVRV